MSRLRIALIGSRELEKNKAYEGDVKICYNVCLRLAQLKVQFTSGLCELGMDGIAQKAYSKALDLGWIDESYFEVYVAEQKNIDCSPLPNKHLAKVRNKDLIEKSEELARSVMGDSHWNNCDEWSRGMHSRNCHQILGWDLESPVDAVICWTPNGKIQGGTATAIKLTMKYNIPVFNLGCKDKNIVYNEIKEFLINKGVIMIDDDDYSLKGKQKDIDFIVNNYNIHGDFAVCAYVWDECGDEHQYMFKVYRSEESGEIFLKSRWDTELYTVDEFTYYYDFYHEVFNIEDWF